MMRNLFVVILSLTIFGCASSGLTSGSRRSQEPFGVVVLGPTIVSEHIYNATFLAIDGRPLVERSWVQLSPGKRKIRLSAHIESQNAVEMARAGGRNSKDSTLDFVIEPGIRYVVAAKLEPGKRNYEWQAVIIRQEKIEGYEEVSDVKNETQGND